MRCRFIDKCPAGNFTVNHIIFSIKEKRDFNALKTPIFAISHQRFAGNKPIAIIGSAQIISQINARGNDFTTAIAPHFNHLG